MPTLDPIRKAEMTAAAEALVDWVRERRALWANDIPFDEAVSEEPVPPPVLPSEFTPHLDSTRGTEAIAYANAAAMPDVAADPEVETTPSVPGAATPFVPGEATPFVPGEATPFVPGEATPFAHVESAPPADAGFSTSFEKGEDAAPPSSAQSQFAARFADGQVPANPPANAAAQWYSAPTAEENAYAIEPPALTPAPPDTPSSDDTPAGSAFASMFARDSALVRWGVRGVAAASVLAAVAWGISRIGPRVTSSVGKLQSSVTDLKSSVSELKSSVSDIAGKGVSEIAGKRDDAASKPADVQNPKSPVSAAAAAGANGRGGPAPAAKTGRLTVESDPAGARVSVDGKQRGPTPLSLDDLAAGPHAVLIESEKGSVRRNVKITAGGTTAVSESIFAGFIKVLAPYEVTVAEGNRALTLDERGQVLVPPGIHELRFINRQLGYNETRRVEVEPGQIATVSLGSGSSTLAVTASEPAEVLVDGRRVGATPITGQSIALGTHDIVVRGASGERRFVTTVTSKPVRLDVTFTKP